MMGEVFLRMFEQREEIALFLEKGRTAKGQDFHMKMTDHTFVLELVYLADYFREINLPNLALQGNAVNILSAQDKVASFLCRLQLCFSVFPIDNAA